MKKKQFPIRMLLIFLGCVIITKNAFSQATQPTINVAPPKNLLVPPLAYDDSSITIIWEKPSEYKGVTSYNVYQNGTPVGNTKNLFYNVTGLEPNSLYSFTVKAVNSSGVESIPSNEVIQKTSPPIKVFNIVDYGAVGDGKTLNTAAIQKAINECTAGGKVLIPAGIFVSGAIFLKSNITLQIEGTLRGSDNTADYPKTSKRFPYYLTGNNFMGLINAYTESYGSIKNVRICGGGIVNGSSDTVGSVIGHKNTILGDNQAKEANEDSARADMLTIKGIDGLYIGGLTFVNPAMHTIFISYCKNITINGINVSTYDIHNADGINICTSDTAYVFGSTFDTGDDCINFNAGVGADGVKENYPDNNIRVFNCTTKHGHGGVAFGSFTAAWIQNVLIEDCTFDGTDIGIRFKTNKSNGGGARNVICRDIKISNIAKDAAIFFDSAYAHTPSRYPSAGPGQFKDITINNVTCTNLKKYGIYISGLEGTPHTNLSLTNITIDGAAAGGAFINYCTNSTFDTIEIKNSTPPWKIDANSTSGLIFKNCTPSPVIKSQAVSEVNMNTSLKTESKAMELIKTPDKKIHFILLGDSTVSDRQGWGPGFKSYLNEFAQCTNLAIGGRSSKSFIAEGRLAKAIALKGDYYLIQFGHNDEPNKGDRTTDPNTTYREFMSQYIDQTRAIGAQPILVTSMVRRQWNKSDPNKINDSSLAPYVAAVKAIAKEKNVPLIDLNASSKQLCEQMGKEGCHLFSPIKDNGQFDNTHLNSKGSIMFARLVVEELIRVVPELKPYFRSEPVPLADTEPNFSNN